ncbi:MAG: ABC transporter permease [Candidatus Brockarchaeota archaeon]|nr:ABC transporter permease [Candidatus Brockarchaeota archaeon]
MNPRSIFGSFAGAINIARKDMRVYYLKPPSIFYGLMFPVSLYLAFTIGRPCIEPEYRLTGIVTIACFFGATTIEAVVFPLEKSAGTFERLLIAPISLRAVVMGKMISGAAFGILTSLVFAAFAAPFSGNVHVEPLLFIPSIVLSSFAFSALGTVISVGAEEITQAMMPLNFVRLVMIFLSGVFLPLEEEYAFMPELKVMAYLLPLTYSVDAVRQSSIRLTSLGAIIMDWAVLASFSVVFMIASVKILRRTIR